MDFEENSLVFSLKKIRAKASETNRLAENNW